MNTVIGFLLEIKLLFVDRPATQFSIINGSSLFISSRSPCCHDSTSRYISKRSPDRPTKKVLKISPMYLSRLLCIHRNNTITELLSSIPSSLELIRWPYGRARYERINREWRKGVIAANWPDHFPSGATRGSFCLLRETIRSRKGARILRNAYEWLCKTFGSRQVRPVLIATAGRLRN